MRRGPQGPSLVARGVAILLVLGLLGLSAPALLPVVRAVAGWLGGVI